MPSNGLQVAGDGSPVIFNGRRADGDPSQPKRHLNTEGGGWSHDSGKTFRVNRGRAFLINEPLVRLIMESFVEYEGLATFKNWSRPDFDKRTGGSLNNKLGAFPLTMKTMQQDARQRRHVIAIAMLYLLYLLIALVIPVFHGRFMDGALEVTRDPILLPAPFLFLKWFSEIAQLLVVVVLVCAIWSWFQPSRVIRLSASCGIILLLFTTLYGWYSSFLLGCELNHLGFTARLFTK